MLRNIDNFYLRQEEPAKSCLMATRELILAYKDGITEAWRYRMPFFLYKNRRICYLWLDKKSKEPYLGVVDGNLIDHPRLEQGNRSRMKILRIDPNTDLPLENIHVLLDEMIKIQVS